MIMRYLAAATALVLLAAPASGQERVSLSFDWPAGLRGTVTNTMDQATGAAGMQMSQRTVTTHRIETEDDPRGLLIRYRDGDLLEFSAPALAQAEGGETYMRATAEASYDMVVDEDGQLLEITRDSASMAKISAAVEEMMGPLRAMAGSEGMAGILDGMLSDEALNATIEQSWTSVVGVPDADALVIGEGFVSEMETPLPMMQNRSLLMDTETTVTGRVPCVEGGAPDACVLVRTESRMDPEDMRMMMDEMFGEMFGGMSTDMQMDLGVGAFEQSMTTESIMEPGTLIPHSMTMKTLVNVEMTMMGQTIPSTQEMTVTVVYDWENR